ncbi:MAG: biotin/lipoyl-containing protein [Pyrinomonadaceae bacterium]
MKLTADIEGEEQTVEVRRDGARVSAEIGGRRYELETRETEPGVYLFVLDGRVYECRVEATDARGAARVRVGGGEFQITLFDPRRLRAAAVGGAQTSGRAVVAASMPGKVVRVLVEEGETVEAGAGLVVVEAMKMQNELKSPKAGTVQELRAREGATVNAGDVLAVVE